MILNSKIFGMCLIIFLCRRCMHAQQDATSFQVNKILDISDRRMFIYGDQVGLSGADLARAPPGTVRSPGLPSSSSSSSSPPPLPASFPFSGFFLKALVASFTFSLTSCRQLGALQAANKNRFRDNFLSIRIQKGKGNPGLYDGCCSNKCFMHWKMFSFPLREISHYTRIFSCPFSHFHGGIFQTMPEFFRSFPHHHSIYRESSHPCWRKISRPSLWKKTQVNITKIIFNLTQSGK